MNDTDLLTAGTEQEADIFVTDCFDDAKYLAMRLVRLATLFACEYGIGWSFLFMFRAGFWGLIGINEKSAVPQHYWFKYIWETMIRKDLTWWGYVQAFPLAGFVISMLGLMALWYVLYSVCLPYRFESTKPGLDVRRCGRCNTVSAPKWVCQSCKSFRPAKIMEIILYGLSCVISLVFAINDLCLLLIGLYCMSSRK